MSVIIDKIKLKMGVSPNDFELWVKEVDYAACQSLHSVRRFVVSKALDVDYDYVEVIDVTSLADFEAEMQTEIFQSLVHRFSQLAEVVETIRSETLLPGYHW